MVTDWLIWSSRLPSIPVHWVFWKGLSVLHITKKHTAKKKNEEAVQVHVVTCHWSLHMGLSCSGLQVVNNNVTIGPHSSVYQPEISSICLHTDGIKWTKDLTKHFLIKKWWILIIPINTSSEVKLQSQSRPGCCCALVTSDLVWACLL